jgi:hypothetical protein
MNLIWKKGNLINLHGQQKLEHRSGGSLLRYQIKLIRRILHKRSEEGRGGWVEVPTKHRGGVCDNNITTGTFNNNNNMHKVTARASTQQLVAVLNHARVRVCVCV